LTVWTFALWAATAGVIVGVALEEYEFVCKVLHCTLRYGPPGLWKFAKRKGWRKSAHHVGFILLVACLAAELVLQAKVEVDSDGKLARAVTDSATANTKAAALLAENVQLEHELAPRNVNLVELINALKTLPRVPLFVSTVDDDEPKKAAGQFLNFERVFFGPGKPWVATRRPLAPWQWDGVVVSYVNSEDGSRTASQNVAETICEGLNSQGIDAKTEGVRFTDGKTPTPGWDATLPENSVVIGVGRKPNLFWENKANRRLGMRDSDQPFTCTEAEAEAWVKEQWRKDKEARPVKK
jgi:hypothetical protein